MQLHALASKLILAYSQRLEKENVKKKKRHEPLGYMDTMKSQFTLCPQNNRQIYKNYTLEIVLLLKISNIVTSID